MSSDLAYRPRARPVPTCLGRCPPGAAGRPSAGPRTATPARCLGVEHEAQLVVEPGRLELRGPGDSQTAALETPKIEQHVDPAQERVHPIVRVPRRPLRAVASRRSVVRGQRMWPQPARRYSPVGGSPEFRSTPWTPSFTVRDHNPPPAAPIWEARLMQIICHLSRPGSRLSPCCEPPARSQLTHELT